MMITRMYDGTMIRTWSKQPIDAVDLAHAFASGEAAGHACAPANRPGGVTAYIDGRLVAEWERGYEVGKAKRLALARAARDTRAVVARSR